MSKLSTVKKKTTTPLKQATLCFLINNKQILLAMKKRGFAAGKWNGAGGKPKDGDKSIMATAKRETFEEVAVIPKKLKRVAVLNFYFEVQSDWNQQVHVFLTSEWNGTPTETEEMSPKWFDLNEIPYDRMWDDDILWLPKVLNGKIVEGNFLFDENQKMLEHDVREIA
ncbi:MAG: 8-oxo-dGTP diphosphatase [Candidatus Woesebacteria bacterium]|nr:8-oxo-dGTP diphosphatase [Candidatus Woesebacteria bacterium]